MHQSGRYRTAATVLCSVWGKTTNLHRQLNLHPRGPAQNLMTQGHTVYAGVAAPKTWKPLRRASVVVQRMWCPMFVIAGHFISPQSDDKSEAQRLILRVPPVSYVHHQTEDTIDRLTPYRHGTVCTTMYARPTTLRSVMLTIGHRSHTEKRTLADPHARDQRLHGNCCNPQGPESHNIVDVP